MKKKMMIMVVVAGLALVGTASAQNCKGGGGYGHHGKMQGGMMSQQLDQETRDKIAQFRDDNQSLRKEIVMKRAEKRAIMSSTNADPAAAAKIAGELFDLRTAMREKAKAAGIENYMGRFGKGGGMGSGSMMGRGHGNCMQGGGRF